MRSSSSAFLNRSYLAPPTRPAAITKSTISFSPFSPLHFTNHHFSCDIRFSYLSNSNFQFNLLLIRMLRMRLVGLGSDRDHRRRCHVFVHNESPDDAFRETCVITRQGSAAWQRQSESEPCLLVHDGGRECAEATRRVQGQLPRQDS